MIESFNDTTNNGVYVEAKLDKESQERLLDFLKGNSVEGILKPDTFHSTIVYSTNSSDPRIYAEVRASKLYPNGTPSGWKLFDTKLGSTGKCLVLTVDSPELKAIHKHLYDKYSSLSYDYDEYIPHVTVSYSVTKAPDELPNMIIRYDKISIKPLDPDYKPEEA